MTKNTNFKFCRNYSAGMENTNISDAEKQAQNEAVKIQKKARAGRLEELKRKGVV